MTSGGTRGPDGRHDSDSEPVVFVDGGTESPKEERHDPWTLVLGILGGVLLGTGVTFAILGLVGIFEEPTPPPPPTIPPVPTLTVPPPTAAPPVIGDSGTAMAVAERAIPSIVAVEVSGLLGDSGGSGVVYGSDGYVITNNHVVGSGGEVAVVFSDGARYAAEVVGTDPLTDLAVLLIDRPDMAPVDIGISANLSIGQSAVAVGNPLALVGGPSVTSGIVSALDRSLEVDGGTILYGLVQTDAPITRGSSGGALLDGNARLIGITTAIAVSDVGAEGLGFAIPIDIALGVVNDLIESGEVNHALLGIRGQTAFAQQDNAQYPVGVIVQEMLANSAYEVGGGQINDVVQTMNGESIITLDQLLTKLRGYRAGDELTMGILRADSELDLIVILGRLES